MGEIISYGIDEANIDPEAITGSASNILTGTNPPYALTDFIAEYPQFGPDSNKNYLVPQVLVQKYINLADTCIKQARWEDMWSLAMGWFVAHFCTLYLQGTADPNSGAAAVIQAGQAKGLDTSVSAGGVSVSTDYSMIANNIDGWVNWKLTIYGTQIITFGRLIGKGGMYIV
jgi:hypothetical protein